MVGFRSHTHTPWYIHIHLGISNIHLGISNLHLGISIESITESLGAESVESGLGLSLSDEFSEHFRSEGFLIMYNVSIYHNAVFVCENLNLFSKLNHGYFTQNIFIAQIKS